MIFWNPAHMQGFRRKNLSKMNELILVSAYCDTEEKTKMLHDLLISLKRQKRKVMLVTHLPCELYIQRCCDYYLYDSENELITEKKYFGFVFFQNADFTLSTRNASSTNTGLAVLKLIFGGVNFAYDNNFEIVHYIEYDTRLVDLSELDKNSNYLVSNPKSTGVSYMEVEDCMVGNYFCLNLNVIPREKFKYDKQLIMSSLFIHGICEQVLLREILQMSSLKKSKDLIRNEKFQTQLVQSGSLRWGIVFYIEDRLHVFLYNHTKDQVIIFNIIEDGTNTVQILSPGHFFMKQVRNGVNYLKIFGNNILYQDYNLNDPVHLQEIHEYSLFEPRK